jgi:hypothetical protein
MSKNTKNTKNTKKSRIKGTSFKRPHHNYDAAWKGVLYYGALYFILYFFPHYAKLLVGSPKIKLETYSGVELSLSDFITDVGMRISDVIIVATLKSGQVIKFVIEQQHASNSDVSFRLYHMQCRLMGASPKGNFEFFVIHTGPPDSKPGTNSEPKRGFLSYIHRGWKIHFFFPTVSVLDLSEDELRKDTRPFSLILLAWILLFKYGDATEEARERGYKEVFDRARELNLDHDQYLFIYRFLWSIFVVYENSALAKKIEEQYLMTIISVEQFRRDYPEALLNKCRMDTTREVTRKVTRKVTREVTRETSIEIATRLLSGGMSINKVVEATKLSREKVVALKAQQKASSQKARSRRASPAPAAS